MRARCNHKHTVRPEVWRDGRLVMDEYVKGRWQALSGMSQHVRKGRRRGMLVCVAKRRAGTRLGVGDLKRWEN